MAVFPPYRTASAVVIWEIFPLVWKIVIVVVGVAMVVLNSVVVSSETTTWSETETDVTLLVVVAVSVIDIPGSVVVLMLVSVTTRFEAI